MKPLSEEDIKLQLSGLFWDIEIDPDKALGEKMTLDTAGHYYRPDIFKFRVNRKRAK